MHPETEEPASYGVLWVVGGRCFGSATYRLLALVCYPLDMSCSELTHLELLAEVDWLADELARWTDAAPQWHPAGACRAVVRRLAERTQSLRVRLEAPLVVATLGGTGTGKSALINALVGADVVQTGRRRPTTTRPTIVCRPGLTTDMLGIDRQQVELVERDLPALANLVLVDCPDPDTTEEPHDPATNLRRLRQILPHCDVLLVTTTQQKYRSARVRDELTAAASGARMIFVQTHADVDQDIRDDWQQVLQEVYTTGHIFFIDSLAALTDARAGLQPRGELAALVDLLTRQIAGAAEVRIRRANFLDLAAETLAACRQRIEAGMPAIGRVQEAVEQQRSSLATKLAGQMRAELLANRRQWEYRLLGQTASRWGFSPFALVLRVFLGLGGLLSSTLLWRARTPAQIALWGTVEGARTWQRHRRQRKADAGVRKTAAACWDQAELRTAAIVLDGHATEAGLDRRYTDPEIVVAEAADAGAAFVADVSAELESLIGRLARRHTGWLIRWRYEILFGALLGVLLYRLGKNFFYDSWLSPDPVPVFGLDFYLSAAFWLVLWCLVLLWAFTSRLRRGLRREIDQLAESWNSPKPAAGIFAQLESECDRAEQFQRELERLKSHVDDLRRRLAQPDEQLGHRR